MNKDALKWVIFGGLFLVPLIPLLVSSSLFFPYITTKAFAFRLIVEVIFAAWLVLAMLDRDYRPKKSPVLYAVGLFLIIIGIANLLGAAPLKSFWSNYERMEGFVVLLHLGAFFLVIGSSLREVHWHRWWNTSLAVSAIMVIYCLFQLAGAIKISQGGVRVDGTFGNATYLAVYMLVHAFIAFFYLARERKNTILRWSYAALLLGQLFILYHTATRGAILGLLGGALIVALLNVRNKESKSIRRASMAAIAALIVIVGGVFLLRNTNFVKGSLVLSRFSSISTEELKSGGRSFVWPMALKGIAERPIFGWGQENFSYIFQKHYSPEMYRLEPWFDRAHNIFLDWLAASGILGLLSYLSLYGVLLYLIWFKDENFSYLEKSIVTGLIAAYFFHNFFVFDHLLSYILFFSLLAHIHSRAGKVLLWEVTLSEKRAATLAAPLAAVLLIFVLYFVNVKPFNANLTLINSLKELQSGQPAQAAASFKQAYEKSYLGRREAAEQIAGNAPAILGSALSIEEKNEFYQFAREAVKAEADKSRDARAYLVAGTFLRSTGQPDEALEYLEEARKLSPFKQMIYIEIAETYFSKGDAENAIKTLRMISEFSPELAPEIEGYIKQIK